MPRSSRTGIVSQIVTVVDADSDRGSAYTNGSGLHTQLVRFLIIGVIVNRHNIISIV